MKRSLFWFAVLAVGLLQARDAFVEAKGAFFYPQSSLFRDIYGTGGMVGVETSMQTVGQLYTWASGSFLIKKGESLGFRDSTRIAFWPIGIGVKYLFPVSYTDFYLGAGALGAYMHIHDHSDSIPQKTCRWGGGGIVKAGAIINANSHLFFDIFTDYSFLYVPVSSRRDLITRRADLSGWSIGLGIGYRFGS